MGNYNIISCLQICLQGQKINICQELGGMNYQ